MKIEAASRLSQPQPPWYDRSQKQVPEYKSHLKNLTVPFPRTSLEITPNLKHTVGEWNANWTVDFTGHITILLQVSFYKACMAAGLEWELLHVIQHEYIEAKLTIADARKKYPDMNPFIMADKDINLGGMAHYKTIKELDGVSESVYNTWLSKIDSYLKPFRKGVKHG